MSSSALRKTQLRMLCQHVGKIPDTNLTRVTLGAVYDPDPATRDHVYGEMTPFGNVSFNVIEEAAQGLEAGKKYLVDIYLAPDQAVVE